MKNEEAIEQYKKLTYDLAKAVAKLYDIRERMGYINQQMEWDGMFEISFDNALKELANVESAAISYSMEDEYRDSDIKHLEESLAAYKNCRLTLNTNMSDIEI